MSYSDNITTTVCLSQMLAAIDSLYWICRTCCKVTSCVIQCNRIILMNNTDDWLHWLYSLLSNCYVLFLIK